MKERKVHVFLNRWGENGSDKSRKKQWYKENSEKVKLKQNKYYAENADDINVKRRLNYNPIRRKKAYDPEKQKESYDSEKRKAVHEKNKQDRKNFIFKDLKVIRSDKGLWPVVMKSLEERLLAKRQSAWFIQ